MSVLFLNPKVHFFILFFYLKNTIFIWVNKKRNLKKKTEKKLCIQDFDEEKINTHLKQQVM